MSEERKSVRSLLQIADSYADPALPSIDAPWREAVLMQVEEEADTSRSARSLSRNPPLPPRHLLLNLTGGAALFGLGWWFGSGGLTVEEIAAVPSGAWVVFAAAVAVVTLWWQGVPSGLFRRR